MISARQYGKYIYTMDLTTNKCRSGTSIGGAPDSIRHLSKPNCFVTAASKNPLMKRTRVAVCARVEVMRAWLRLLRSWVGPLRLRRCMTTVSLQADQNNIPHQAETRWPERRVMAFVVVIVVALCVFVWLAIHRRSRHPKSSSAS